MSESIRLNHPVLRMVNGALVDLPSPSNISYLWNFGSLLGGCLVLQILTGLFLAMHYSCGIEVAFESVSHIVRDVNFGWALRYLHANGASLFFVLLYVHVARGVYYGGYRNSGVWGVGVLILLCLQGTAFLGYVLPWGQMSFWGATVITNLISSIPYLGGSMVEWLWGGFSVDNATLVRFFAFHFLLPFVVCAMVGVHLIFLHETGSMNPLGLDSSIDKVPFHPYFSDKDLLGAVIVGFVFSLVVFYYPNALGDPENYIPANALVTPPHIQPEWYFLFAYAILRAVPNKLGGVIALVGAILVLVVLSGNCSKFSAMSFYPAGKLFFWGYIVSVLLLTYIGAKPVEAPYIGLGQLLSVYYFSFYFFIGEMNKFWDSTVL